MYYTYVYVQLFCESLGISQLYTIPWSNPFYSNFDGDVSSSTNYSTLEHK